MKNIHRSLIIGCSMLALTSCGPEDVASPGTGGDVIINYPPAPTPAPTPTPTPVVGVTPAAGCPTIADPQGLTDSGTISGPTGEWRVCTLPTTLKTSTTLPKIPGLLYSMNGRVNVGCDGGPVAPTAYASTTPNCTATPLAADTNVTLTIAPGVILFGNTGQSWLAVNRGNKVSAVGDAANPIIFTSRDNILGLNSASSQGQWGGVVLLGRGIVTDCNYGAAADIGVTVANAADMCQRDTEGVPGKDAIFGGRDNAYNAGKVQFVQIRYSGFVLGSGKELQSLTNEGVGTGTTLDHIMSFNSSDDGSETFGGAVNMKYYISVGADDDSIDVDTGAQMNVQYAMLIQRPGKGDSLMEIDSPPDAVISDAVLPRTKFQLSNFIGFSNPHGTDNDSADHAATMLRGNSDTTWVNGIIYAPDNQCITMNGSAGLATLTPRSVVMTCGGGTDGAQNDPKYFFQGTYTVSTISNFFGSGANGNDSGFTSSLTNVYFNGANEDGKAVTDPTTYSAFFDVPAHIGAAYTGNSTWYAGWTCNSPTANFGSGNSGDCTSLPIT